MASKKISISSALPFYLVGFIWFFSALFFDLYKIMDFILLCSISFFVYAVSSKLIPKKIIVYEEIEFEKTADKKVNELLAKGKSNLELLKITTEKINNPQMKGNATNLFNIAEEIYLYVSKNTNSISNIRKFNEYYFPESIKILESYVEFENMQTPSTSVISVKEKMENSIFDMINVFKTQLDSLVNDKVFDISADIKVLETLLKEDF